MSKNAVTSEKQCLFSSQDGWNGQILRYFQGIYKIMYYCEQRLFYKPSNWHTTSKSKQRYKMTLHNEIKPFRLLLTASI